MSAGNLPDGGGSFEYVPYFNFNDGALKFDNNDADNPNDNNGTAVAFLPEFLI